MRALVVSFVVLMTSGSLGFAQDQTLRGVYGPAGAAPPAARSGTPAAAALGSGPIGVGPRVTIAGKAAEGQTLPSDVSPAPISDRPGYGTAIVNGHRSIIDLNNNRIVQVTD
ncbi:MAG TPA: hypothetical protein VLI91_06775 [Roseiarcus sp.]|nr:hypothetical protein [Roseiarcus sp.]